MKRALLTARWLVPALVFALVGGPAQAATGTAATGSSPPDSGLILEDAEQKIEAITGPQPDIWTLEDNDQIVFDLGQLRDGSCSVDALQPFKDDNSHIAGVSTFTCSSSHRYHASFASIQIKIGGQWHEVCCEDTNSCSDCSTQRAKSRIPCVDGTHRYRTHGRGVAGRAPGFAHKKRDAGPPNRITCRLAQGALSVEDFLNSGWID